MGPPWSEFAGYRYASMALSRIFTLGRVLRGRYDDTREVHQEAWGAKSMAD